MREVKDCASAAQRNVQRGARTLTIECACKRVERGVEPGGLPVRHAPSAIVCDDRLNALSPKLSGDGGVCLQFR